MNTDHFNYVIEICNAGSLSQAAKNLHVSQPVLSRFLINLEKTYHTEFFFSEKHRLHLTEQGKILLANVIKMHDLDISMHQPASFQTDPHPPVLRVGLTYFHGGADIAMFYPRLLEKYPGLNLSTVEGNTEEQLRALQEGRVSCLLNLWDPEYMPDTQAATLMKVEMLLTVPSFHPIAAYGGTAKKPAVITLDQLHQLQDLSFIYMDEHTLVGRILQDMCKRYEFHPHVLLKTSNAITIKQLLANGTYGGFVNSANKQSDDGFVYFRLPVPVILYSALIYLKEHTASDVEAYLYWLETMAEAATHPNSLSINDLGRELLKKVETNGNKNL
jgi:DNA-binding transcriptional LysR family regulator